MTAEANSAFSREQYADNYPPGIERLFWNVARNATILRWLRAAGMDRMRLLEIGCARGIVVDYLRGRGIDCTGCDLGRPPVPPRLTNSVYPTTDFRTLPLAIRNSIGGVLLCDVIEHIHDAPSFLQTLPEFLPSLTKLLITVPARAELWSAWDDHFGHVRRYDLDLLRRELNAAGLSPVVSRYFFQSLYLPMHLTKRRRRAAIKPPSMTWAHRIVSAAMTAEQWIVPSRVPGTSIIAMAEVPTRHLT